MTLQAIILLRWVYDLSAAAAVSVLQIQGVALISGGPPDQMAKLTDV